MTHTADRAQGARLSDTARHWLTAIVTVVGVVAAALGTWMAYGPDDAMIRVFNWTWSVADIAELWAPWLMIGGGFLASIGMSWEAFRADDDTNVWIRVLEGTILIAGLAAVGVGIFLLF